MVTVAVTVTVGPGELVLLAPQPASTARAATPAKPAGQILPMCSPDPCVCVLPRKPIPLPPRTSLHFSTNLAALISFLPLPQEAGPAQWTSSAR